MKNQHIATAAKSEDTDDRLLETSHVGLHMTVDGCAWLLIVMTSLLSMLALTAGIDLVPIPTPANVRRSMGVLGFIPVVSAALLIALRRVPIASHQVSAWLRAAVLTAFFFASLAAAGLL